MGKFLIYIVVFLLLVSQAHGATLFHSFFDDLAGFSSQRSLPAIDEFPLERSTIDCAYQFDNLFKNRSTELKNTIFSMNCLVPLHYNKDLLSVLVTRSNALVHFEDQNTNSFAMKTAADFFAIEYGIKLTEKVEVRTGITQTQSLFSNSQKNPGLSYGLKIKPFDFLNISYSSMNNSQGILTNVDSAYKQYESLIIDAATSSQLVCDLNFSEVITLKINLLENKNIQTQSLDNFDWKSSLELGYMLNRELTLFLMAGKGNSNNNMRFYDNEQIFAFLNLERASFLYGMGMGLKIKDKEWFLSYSRSTFDYSSGGKVFNQVSPDVLSNIDNFDKYMDAKAFMQLNSYQLSVKGIKLQELSIEPTLQYQSMDMRGNIDFWNTWFFGLLKELDSTQPLNYQRIDFLVLSGSLAYDINETWKLRYSMRQILPILALQDEVVGGGSVSSALNGPADYAQGGNTQTFSLTCYF